MPPSCARPCRNRRTRSNRRDARRRRDRDCSSTCAAPLPAATLCTRWLRSEEHTSELQSLMRNSYAVFCLKKKKQNSQNAFICRKHTNKNRDTVEIQLNS